MSVMIRTFELLARTTLFLHTGVSPGNEEVRALLGHSRIDTTQVYARIRPPQLKRAVAFYEEKAVEILTK